ncbi:MAG: DUF1573 domain-containing protein [Phycisphaerae bacterium]|jgi:hypothetical protein
MNKRFCNFLVIVLALLFVISSQSQAKSKKPFIKLGDKKTPAVKAESAKPEANQPAQSFQSSTPSNARIKFDSTEHDFGTIGPDSLNTCKFTFKNAGKDVLKIDRLQGTCKCTVPDLKKKEYAPGESGEITVEFHAPKYQGNTSQHIMVFSNDSDTPRAELEIKAYVQLQVQVKPEQINLSLVDPDAGTGPITIISVDGEKFAVTKVESAGNVVSFAIDPNNMSDKHVLKPLVNAANLRKNLNGGIIFTLNHSKCKEARITFSCLKEFEATPSVIILRNAIAGEVQKRSIFLTSNYNQPIEIDSVTSDKGIIKMVNQQQAENKFQFDVEIAPPPQEGKLRVFSDMLHIKIKGKEEIAVPCRGFYKLSQ